MEQGVGATSGVSWSYCQLNWATSPWGVMSRRLLSDIPGRSLFFFFFQRFNSDIIKRFRPFMPLLEGICCIYCNAFGHVGWYIAFLCFLKSVRVSLLYLLKAGWLSSVAKASPGETGEEHHIHSLPFSSVHLIQTSVPQSLEYLHWITQRVLQVSSWSVYQ